MSSEKTEQPTPKKLRDAAKKGQGFKPRDLIVALMLFCACSYLTFTFSLSAVGEVFKSLVANGFELPVRDYIPTLGTAFFKIVLPIIALCTLTSAIPSLLLSKFSLATEAFKIDFNKLNPVEGAKKLFTMKTVKELVKAVLYLVLMVVAAAVFWNLNKNIVFSLLSGTVENMIVTVPKLFFSLIFIVLGCNLPLYLLDGLVEYFLHIKNLKMAKHEVKQEYKEQEGNPEVKQVRRQMHMDILSEQVKSDVKHSNFILANPTHIAIGIYFNPELYPAPLVSVLEVNVRAQAVIAYAEKCGIPVVRDIPLARGLFKSVRRYAFIPLAKVHGIFRILEWLYMVEMNGQVDPESEPEVDEQSDAVE